MTDLQLGLLVIGAAVVAGVLAYNRLQERAVRRRAQRSFGSAHADVLADEAPARREPVLGPAEETPPPPPAEAPMDYFIEVHGVPRGELEQRFGSRALVADGGVALQMVSRRGAIGEHELLEFRAQVESLAARHGGTVSAPEMRAALEAAHALDKACAEVDIQIALHVVGIDAAKSLASLEQEVFKAVPRAEGLTLLLDVPRTPDLLRSYEAMVQRARALGGRMVDDNGNPLDERGLAAIGVELEATRARLAEMGIEPGSPLALRLFS
jgi:hypothetical protein